MTKLINKAFTNYFFDLCQVEILSYDNNKYVKIKLPNGKIDEVKRGYLYRDEKLTKRISEVNWFIHGGGKRENYKPRVTKTTYATYEMDYEKTYSTKKEALHWAIKRAKINNHFTSIYSCTGTNSSWQNGLVTIDCFPDGTAIQYDNQRSNRYNMVQGKYLRGYGKIKKRK